MSLLPQGVKADEQEIQKAKELATATSTVVRYLRKKPTVELATIFPRDAAGKVIVDAPPLRKKVICKGSPYGCIIAFLDNDGHLNIGWSKRIDNDPDYFQKDRARITATLRGLKDELIDKNGRFRSKVSEAIPTEVCRALSAFIPRMKKHFDQEVKNLK